MENVRHNYLPAAGRGWALPLYDPLVKLLGAERAKNTLLKQVDLRPMHRVLDVGCGTGTLAVLIKRLNPDVHVVGLDPDPKALARGARKARQATLSIRFDEGFSDELPYPDASFDRVLSSFMFHHLETATREKTLREIRRVLAPGGSLHLLDFEQTESPSDRPLVRWIHSNPHFKDNSERRILTLMRQVEFDHSQKVTTGALVFGLFRVGYYQASVSGPAVPLSS